MRGKPSGDDIVVECYNQEQKDVLEEMEIYLSEFKDLMERIRLSGIRTLPLVDIKGELRAIHLKKTSVNIPNKEFVMGIAFKEPF